MTDNHDFFTPDSVDEQIDQLFQNFIKGHLPRNTQTEDLSQTEASLVGDLKAHYQVEQQENIASLQRAWQGVAIRLGDREHSQSNTQPLPTPKERVFIMRKHVSEVSREGIFSRRLSLLVAVLVAALLVGSLITIVKLGHHPNTNTGSTNVAGQPAPTTKPTLTPTSTPAPVFGKTLYTTPANQWGFNGLSWSPDSKRIASSTVDTRGVQIWDAITGEHLVTVLLSDGERAYGLSWSPNNENVAVATNQHILIVNGQTGEVTSSYPANGPTAKISTSSRLIPFSSLYRSSTGASYSAISWSPDGHLLASAHSFGPYGEVQVLNPQTDATDFTLKVGNSENIGSLAWSSDGQYIAANTWNTQPTGLTQPINKVIVWNVSTQQIVFQHSDTLLSSNAPIAWQPGNHNLAFIGITPSGSTQAIALEIWNATTGKLVKQYAGEGATPGTLTWSPDGTYLIYAQHIGLVIIRNATTTGEQVFVYKGHTLPVSEIVWSPDGKYIASAEGNAQGQMVAKVWTA